MKCHMIPQNNYYFNFFKGILRLFRGNLRASEATKTLGQKAVWRSNLNESPYKPAGRKKEQQRRGRIMA
jgi:hypothetical protein